MSEKSKTEEVLTEVKETVTETADSIVTVTETEVKETTTTESTTACKKTWKTYVKEWLNRVWAAIVGAAVAVGAMFGITSEQVKEQTARAELVKLYSADALYSLQHGDVKTAIDKLKTATEAGKEIAVEAKKVIDTAKTTKKDKVIDTAVDAAKAELKKDAPAKK